MRLRSFVVIVMLTAITSACIRPEPMKVEIKQRKILHGVPSASGIEKIGDAYWLLSDNSPWIFVLNEQLDQLDRIAVTDDTINLEDGVIPKPRKHDMEAMFTFLTDNGEMVVLLGSGSSKNRMHGRLMSVEDPAGYVVIDLTRLYNGFIDQAGLDPDELNIEAAAIAGDHLYLFNRDKNKVARISIESFNAYMDDPSTDVNMKIYGLHLPSIGGIKAGFSGATTTKDGTKIVFTASVENTSDWVQDGEVLGSLVGFIPVSELKDGYEPNCITLHDKGEPVLLKVESLVVSAELGNGEFDCVLVTDSDGGDSEFLEIRVSDR
jgi:hypothetical protein